LCGRKDRQDGRKQSDFAGGISISQVDEFPLVKLMGQTGRATAVEAIGGRRLQQSFYRCRRSGVACTLQRSCGALQGDPS